MKLTVCSLLILTFLFLKSVNGRRIIRAAPNVPTTGNFVVRLNQSITHDEFKKIEEEIMRNTEGSPVYEVDNDLIKVVTVKINETMLDEVKHLKGVEYLEEETYAHGTDIPYSIDQIDQGCSQPLDNLYQPIGDGDGIDIYILDSGIHYTHEQFDGRAKYSGKDPIDDYYEDSNNQGLDCHGHGTHCASLAGGKTTGTARKANLYSVRVLGCDNFGPWTAIINGLNHVVDRAKETKRPTIISMSLGGGYYQTVDDLISSIVKMDISVIVAAGNDRYDACDNTPASNKHAITVGASKSGREMYYYSNGGVCVDIIAPGQSILGADRDCNSCTKYLTGTSMATPLVAGIAAIHLQRHPKMNAADLKQKIIDDACVGTLDLTSLEPSLHASTPNRLLHITGNCGGEYYIDSSGSKEVFSPGYPDNYPDTGVFECVYKLTTDRGKVVRLIMNEFSTYDSADYLQIIDGYYVETKFLLASLNTSLPSKNEYQSTVNALTLRFITNADNNGKGFRGTFDSVASIPIPIPTTTPATTTTTITTTSTIAPSTVTSTVTRTDISTVTSSLSVFVTSLSVHTVFSTKTTSITATPTKTETIFKTTTETSLTTSTIKTISTVHQTHTITTTAVSIGPSTITVTVQPTDLPTPINLLPSGTPTNDLCCLVLNNVDVMSNIILQEMNGVMERGVNYISKILDKNSTFTIEDVKPDKPQIINTTSTSQSVASDISGSDIIPCPSTTNPTPFPGLTITNPASSCAEITSGKSGQYWIQIDDVTVKSIFCELEEERVKGMAKIVNIDMKNNNTKCPEGLENVTVQGKTLCGRQNNIGCTSTFFNTSGLSYNKVCGIIKGYQYASPNAFYWYTRQPSLTINDAYVDGVVLSFNNNNERNHIWTFAAAIDEVQRDALFACPCTHNNTIPYILPGFMSDDYFCDTGSVSVFKYDTYYMDNPLWDGKGCGPNSSCCSKAGLFCKEIDISTKSPIELRICGNEIRSNEDTPLETIVLYIQ